MNRTPLLLLTALACAPAQVLGEHELFTLELRPRAFGTDLQRLERSDLLLVRGETRYTVSQEPQGGWRWKEVSPLRGERLGLWFEDGQGVHSWGQSPPLEIEDGTASADVWVLPTHQPTTFGPLTQLAPPLGAAMAITETGDIWWFGGASDLLVGPGNTQSASAEIWRIPRNAPAPEPELAGLLTSPGGSLSPRVHATATTVRIRGRQKVFVAGGRPGVGATDPHDEALVFDPLDLQTARRIVLPLAVAQHHAFPLDDTRVLVIGGVLSTGPGRAPWFVVDVASGTSTAPDVLTEAGGWGLATARLPGGGIAACGGARIPERGEVTLEPQAGCYQLHPDRPSPVRRLPDLPQPVAGGALAALRDGTLILSGGLSQPLEPDALTPASNRVWRLSPQATAWEQLGQMTSQRAHHLMGSLRDGEVLILGGVTASGGHPTLVLGEASGAPEALDAERETTRAVPDTAPITGAWPPWAYAPGDVAAVLQGTLPPGSASPGGQVLGLVALPPPEP